MSYTIDEWFEEIALPILLKTFKEMEEIKNHEMISKCDLFMNAINQIFIQENDIRNRKNDFKKYMIKNMFYDGDIIEMMKEYFNLITDGEKQLSKIEYMNKLDKVFCKFRTGEDYEQ